MRDWDEHGNDAPPRSPHLASPRQHPSPRGRHDLPLLVNVIPSGQFLCESFYRAGGVPAVMGELLAAGLLDGAAPSRPGRKPTTPLRSSASRWLRLGAPHGDRAQRGGERGRAALARRGSAARPRPSLALAPVPWLTSRRILPQDVIRTAAAPLRARAGFRARVGVEAHSARDRDTSAPPSLGFRVVSGSFVASALLRRRPLLGPSRSLL